MNVTELNNAIENKLSQLSSQHTEEDALDEDGVEMTFFTGDKSLYTLVEPKPANDHVTDSTENYYRETTLETAKSFNETEGDSQQAMGVGWILPSPAEFRFLEIPIQEKPDNERTEFHLTSKRDIKYKNADISDRELKDHSVYIDLRIRVSLPEKYCLAIIPPINNSDDSGYTMIPQIIDFGAVKREISIPFILSEETKIDKGDPLAQLFVINKSVFSIRKKITDGENKPLIGEENEDESTADNITENPF